MGTIFINSTPYRERERERESERVRACVRVRARAKACHSSSDLHGIVCLPCAVSSVLGGTRSASA